MKITVFGGSGFVGSHIADALTEEGHEVTIFDKVKSKYLQKKQKMIVGDILDPQLVEFAVKNADYVYHFAGIADIREASNDPIKVVKDNILATVYILEACRKFRIRKFIYASTVYVYSELGSFYRSSKQASELFIENYHKRYNLDYTILRYGSLYGKRANNFNFIYNAVKQALLDGKICRESDGNEIRDYINVVDAAKASVDILLDSTFDNSCVMITGTQTMRVKEILNMIKEMLNHKISLEYSDKTYEDHYEITPYSFKPRMAKKYIPKHHIDLGEGILECIYDVYKEVSKDSLANLKINIPFYREETS